MTPTPELGSAPRNFWARNWKWLLPVGCLSVLAPCTCAGGLLAVSAYRTVTGSGPSLEAVAIASSDPEVQALLGEDIHPGLGFFGTWTLESHGKHAALAIPLEGSRGKGTLKLDAQKEEGVWQYAELAVELTEGGRIDLLPRLAPDQLGPEAPGEGVPDELSPPDEGELEDDGAFPFPGGAEPGDQKI